ncbi:kinase-like domain-containing protein [Russula vinacea]|nr:kinase-like domain-containing protein [Russula vinacea]
MLIVEVDGKSHTYTPRSDFLVLTVDLPRIAVEVNSHSPDRPPVDHHRVILQGASVVRFANTFLDAYKKERNFIYVAIFISDIGQVDRYLLYQKEGSRRVYRKKQVFQVSNTVGCLKFALELYNLSSALNDESESGDTKRKVEELATSVSKVSKEHKLPTFTGKTKRGEDQAEPNVRRKANDGGANEQLEACGYEVVPDVLETDGGAWELISKLPHHILTVYRRRDPNKTELIAKRLREGSNEADILKYLHTIRPQSPHVISFIEAIPSITTEWLILPKLHSIGDQLFMNRSGVRSRVQLGWGLIKGLAYLHEHKVAHRDIKPHNLVCDGDFRLQIIDFDVAIKVQDENTEIDEYRGTKNWTAPEMGDEEGPTPMYSPIKADRWSCGRVLLRHIMIGRDKQLSNLLTS